MDKEFRHKMNQLKIVDDKYKEPEIDNEIINLILKDDEDDAKENANRQEYE